MSSARSPSRGAHESRRRASRRRVLPSCQITAMYVPRCRGHLHGPAIAEIRPRFPDVPAVVDKSDGLRSADWPYPKHSGAARRSCARPPHSRSSAAAPAGAVLPGGQDHAARCGNSRRRVRAMVRDGLARTGSTRSRSPAVDADFSVRRRGRRHGERPVGTGRSCSPRLRVDAFSVKDRDRIQKVRRTVSRFAPEGLVAPAPVINS